MPGVVFRDLNSTIAKLADALPSLRSGEPKRPMRQAMLPEFPFRNSFQFLQIHIFIPDQANAIMLAELSSLDLQMLVKVLVFRMTEFASTTNFRFMPMTSLPWVSHANRTTGSTAPATAVAGDAQAEVQGEFPDADTDRYSRVSQPIRTVEYPARQQVQDLCERSFPSHDHNADMEY